MKHEGVTGLYKGVVSPLSVVVPVRSLTFVLSDQINLGLQEISPDISPITSAAVSGMLAGLTTLSLVVPSDLLKIRAQTHKNGSLNYRKEVKNILRREGPVGLYRGFGASVGRDVPYWGIYFTSFLWLK